MPGTLPGSGPGWDSGPSDDFALNETILPPAPHEEIYAGKKVMITGGLASSARTLRADSHILTPMCFWSIR